jgi:hypothetical protein
VSRATGSGDDASAATGPVPSESRETLGDLGTWAASGTGDVLLPEDLVTKRNDTKQLAEGISYGLGVLRFGGWYGHEGEAPGWETLALKDTKSGVTVAVAGNSCGVLGELASVITALYPQSPLG